MSQEKNMSDDQDVITGIKAPVFKTNLNPLKPT